VSAPPRCRYHCRACGAHFSSLEAFDAHRVGPFFARRCEFPEKVPYEERLGTCSHATPGKRAVGVTILGLPSRAAEHFGGRERARAERK
jgi:hypothetical protein